MTHCPAHVWVVLPLGLASDAAKKGVAPIPCLSEVIRAILTVNNGFKFDAQMSSLRQHQGILTHIALGLFSLCFCGWLALLFFFFGCATSLEILVPNRGLDICPSFGPNTGPPRKRPWLLAMPEFTVLALLEHYLDYSTVYLPRPWLSCSLLSVKV